ncbi:MAG: hypothetical protein WC867_08720 [Candidatus Pacearchaeota archaeon]|jgi:hypothetical protein
MGLFSKQKEELVNSEPVPGLPELPEMVEDMPVINQEYTQSALPVISQPEIVKPITIIQPPSQSEEFGIEYGMQKSKFDTINNIDDYQQEQPKPIIQSKEKPKIEPPPKTIERVERKEIKETSTISKKDEPVYLRLDKFKITMDNFDGIKDKLKEMEKLIQKLRDIKGDEEKELTEWEQEIQIIKARMETIDKTIFDKFD